MSVLISISTLVAEMVLFIGMGGALDSSRFKYFLSQALGCNANEVEGMVTVSYTHLDVYKRQHLCYPNRFTAQTQPSTS